MGNSEWRHILALNRIFLKLNYLKYVSLVSECFILEGYGGEGRGGWRLSACEVTVAWALPIVRLPQSVFLMKRFGDALWNCHVVQIIILSLCTPNATNNVFSTSRSLEGIHKFLNLIMAK